MIQDIQIPSSVSDLIQARLGDLSEEEKDILDVASCCGFEFDPLLVAAVLGLAQIPAMKLLARIEKRHRLVRSSGRRYVFDHHQVQESLYDGMSELLREPYHAAIADALETRENAADTDLDDLDGRLCVELCEHFLKGAHGASALRYLGPALEHLETGYLSDQASALAARALDASRLLEGRERVEIQLRLNQALQTLGRRGAQETLLEEALALAAATDDDALRARVRSDRGYLFNSVSRFAAAQTEYEAALALATRSGDREQEIEAHRGLGSVFTHLAQYEAATAHLEQGLSICREIGARRREARVAGTLGIVYWRQGRNEEALRQHERNVELAAELGDRRGEAAGTGCIGLVYMAQGRNAEARAHTERALGIFRAIGDRLGEASELGNRAIALVSDGLAAEALAGYRRARAMTVELGIRRDEAIDLHNEGLVLASLGAPELAEACQRAALDISREIGYRFLEALTTTELADRLADLGDFDAAERLHGEALAHTEAMGARDQHAGEAHLRYGVFLGRIGRADEGRPHLEEALAIGKAAGTPSLEALALLRLALPEDGDPAAALAVVTEAEALMGHAIRVEARFLLYRATGDTQHLEAAHDLLLFFVEHAPEEYKETTLTHVALHRDIVAAWASLDPERA